MPHESTPYTEDNPYLVRSHHWLTWIGYGINCLYRLNPCLNLREACDKIAQRATEPIQDRLDFILTEPQVYDREKVRFRGLVDRELGKDDPQTIQEDYLWRDPEAYIKNMSNVLYNILSLPRETPVRIGAQKDEVCNSCVFGNGNGGLHCQTINHSAENQHLYTFLTFAKNFFPDEFKQHKIYLIDEQSHKRTLTDYTNLKFGDNIEFDTNIGFIRDVITRRFIGFDRFESFLNYINL